MSQTYLDFRFCSDKTGKYFVDTKPEKKIREPVKPPVQIAFEKNLKFLNQETYPPDFFRMLFTESSKIKVVRAGKADFPTGKVMLADPIACLGTRYETRWSIILSDQNPLTLKGKAQVTDPFRRNPPGSQLTVIVLIPNLL